MGFIGVRLKMGRVYVSPNQASNFISKYKWWIIGVLVLIVMGVVYYA